jgi:hypothetical protein
MPENADRAIPCNTGRRRVKTLKIKPFLDDFGGPEARLSKPDVVGSTPITRFAVNHAECWNNHDSPFDVA